MADQKTSKNGGDRLSYSVPEAARALGISRAFAYELVRAGTIRTIRLGRRVLVPRSALDELLERGVA